MVSQNSHPCVAVKKEPPTQVSERLSGKPEPQTPSGSREVALSLPCHSSVRESQINQKASLRSRVSQYNVQNSKVPIKNHSSHNEQKHLKFNEKENQ